MLVEQLLTVSAVIFLYVTVLFIVSMIVKRNDIADIAWGIGIVLVTFVSFYNRVSDSFLINLVLILITLWGVRLSVRILLRNIKKTEDYRYKVWRDTWGKWFYIRSYLQVYLLQGMLMVVVGYPAIHMSVYGGDTALGAFGILGVLVWIVGYFFEVVGDFQLDRFIKNPENKGKILQSGLWKYTRHPNYFGEVTMWWGVFLIVVTLPFGISAIVSPLMITFLILKVSGIPMLEEKFAGNPAFERYKRRTSVFFPWPPKHID